MIVISSCPFINYYKTFVVYALLVVFSLLGGCVNYFGINSHKKIVGPAQFETKKSLPNQKGHWPSTQWAKQFGDPQLTALINEALVNNPDLQAAKARITQAQALAAGKQALLLPAIKWQGQAARGRLSATLFPPIIGGGTWFTFGEFLYTLNYELDIWGKNLASFKQALSQEKAAEASEQESRLSIAASVASSYNQLAYYYALQEILQRTLMQRKSLDKLSSIRLKSGLDTKVQLFQARNLIATTQTQLVDTEGQILLARQQLGTLLGAGPDRGLRIKRPALAMTRTPPLPANLPLNLIGRRPDIVAARWYVEAAGQGINNTKAKFYPNINIFALAGYLSLGLSRLFETASTEYQLGPALSLPIFDAGALRAQLRGQYGNYEEAVANYNATLNNALSDVAMQLTSIGSIDRQLSTQREALDSAARAYQLAKIQYRTGLASQLIVLNAETSFLNEQQTRLQLMTNRRNLQIALIKALGGGFNAAFPDAKKHARCCRSSRKNTPRIVNE